MSFEPNSVPLSQIAKLRSGFPFKSADWQSSGVPVIKIANVKGGRISQDGCGFVTHAVASKVPEWMTKDGDVLIAMTGYVGEVAWVRPGERFLINQRVGRFEFLNDSTVLPGFLYYYLLQPEIRFALEDMARGSAQPNLSAGDAAKLAVPVLPLSHQRQIVSFGRALDDRIDNLRATNATLEAIAQAIFKSWFIDFDPVRAKMEGREPEGMDAETAALFPSEFEESELGLIPRGWKVVPVEQIAKISGGKQLSRDEFIDEGEFPIFGGAGVMGRANRANAEGFVIVLGRVGAYCGQFFWHRGPAWVNNNASLVTPINRAGEWLINLMWSIDMNKIKKGAAQPFVSNGDLGRVEVADPGSGLIAEFAKVGGPLFERIASLQSELNAIAQLRDNLLPRLISGKLKLPERVES